jgi:hypothetical protein
VSIQTPSLIRRRVAGASPGTSAITPDISMVTNSCSAIAPATVSPPGSPTPSSRTGI